MFHACFMHENMDISCMKPVYSRCIPCIVQAYSKHDTGVFHAWFMCIPCVIQAYSMRSTGAFHDTGIFHSCVHTQYSYRHILITLGQSTCTIILAVSMRHFDFGACACSRYQALFSPPPRQPGDEAKHCTAHQESHHCESSKHVSLLEGLAKS